ncbi:MAG: N-acetylmuramoyl-L-alanine amidase [Rhodopseudomonas palustris]|nr:N-acetylmuramoyl-L-alanine amidase [Rhodopseudomonas palustris]
MVKKVILDPGHGGDDFGAIGKKKHSEKDLVLAICMRLADVLKRRGHDAST